MSNIEACRRYYHIQRCSPEFRERMRSNARRWEHRHPTANRNASRKSYHRRLQHSRALAKRRARRYRARHTAHARAVNRRSYYRHRQERLARAHAKTKKGSHQNAK